METDLEKKLYCKYDPAFSDECSRGAVRVYIPTARGYINYNVARAIHDERVADIWRTSTAYACDDNFENEFALNPSAEWDMALRINGRDDFIGGVLHGDEVSFGMNIFVDGREVKPSLLSDLAEFETLSITVDSVGYDPADHITSALLHSKEYIFTSDGLTLLQRVEWLGDYTLGFSYMAMMPPLKKYTDRYFTDTDEAVREIIGSKLTVEGCRGAVLFGEGGLSFKMSIPKYQTVEWGGLFEVCDNGGRPYNKMYYHACRKGDKVSRGSVWETRTEYRITNGEAPTV